MGLKERGEQNINDMKTKRGNSKGGKLKQVWCVYGWETLGVT